MARKEKAPKAEKGPGRIKQIREAYTLTKQHDSKIGLWTAGAFLGPAVVAIVVGFLLGAPFVFIPLGILLGLVVALSVFGRRSQRASYAAVEGMPGVAAAVVERMRGQWIISPAVQLNRDQDMVHRVLGRCGVVLLAEGRGAGQLIGPEVKRLRKVINDTPINVITVGEGEGQTPLQKLQVTMVRFPRVLSAGDVTALDRKIKALPGSGTPLPIPKGPMPTRVPKGARR